MGKTDFPGNIEQGIEIFFFLDFWLQLLHEIFHSAPIRALESGVPLLKWVKLNEVLKQEFRVAEFENVIRFLIRPRCLKFLT